ncbi:hypothetical protein tpqmel_1040, partial [Candidatus Gastranaerophilus sp. (ex Termes propinquus)]
DGAMVFKNAFWMHSFFMRFDFNAIYLDCGYNVIEHHKNIRPYRVLPPVWRAKYVIEYAGEPIEVKGRVEFVDC